jgi:SnoaL-like protein
MSERRWSAIHELVHRYAVLVDERDLDGAARLFVDDAELVLPTPPRTLTPVRELRGRAEIRAGLGGPPEPGPGGPPVRGAAGGRRGGGRGAHHDVPPAVLFGHDVQRASLVLILDRLTGERHRPLADLYGGDV